MKTVLKIIGGLQIAVALVVIIMAFTIDASIASVARTYCEIGKTISSTMAENLETYQKYAGKVCQGRASLTSISQATRKTSQTMMRTGVTMQTATPYGIRIPGMDKMGDAVIMVGKEVNVFSRTIGEQAAMLEKYEKETLPETQAAMERIIQRVDKSVGLIRQFQTGENKIGWLVGIIGFFFLLNGSQVLINACRKPLPAKEAALAKMEKNADMEKK